MEPPRPNESSSIFLICEIARSACAPLAETIVLQLRVPLCYKQGMSSTSLWPRFQKHFLRYDDLEFSIDISRMRFGDDFLAKMQPHVEKAFAAMRELEAGAIANPDENRMVGHYWLRNPGLAPSAELRRDIEETNGRINQFTVDVHAGKIAPQKGGRFKHVLLVGIGGSALGPQFIADALGPIHRPDGYSFPR